jgi:hypothetical protein
MDVYSQIASQIIKDQEVIIGPIALEQAKKVKGLTITSIDNITIKGDTKSVLEELVGQYVRLFGRASVEICKEAVHEIKSSVSTNELPDILR